MELIAKPLAVDSEDGEVVRGVAGHHHPLPAQAEGGGGGQLGSTFQRPAKICWLQCSWFNSCLKLLFKDVYFAKKEVMTTKTGT